MTTFGDTVYQNGGAPVGDVTQGDTWYVKPSSGLDANTGKKLTSSKKTLAHIQTIVTANQNDTIWYMSESSSASSTTDYLSATLAWAKSGVHLRGKASGSIISSRARVAQLSTTTGLAPMVTFSGSNCYTENIAFFQGVDDATSIGCFNVTGSRNKFFRCHFGGIGHATGDVANSYSLAISGGEENVFEQCVIGLDTIARGSAANSELRLQTGATRNVFRDCLFITYAEAAGHQFVIVPSNGIDRWNYFINCGFINMPTGVASGTTMDEAFDVTGGGSPDGLLFCKDCSFIGVTDVEKAAVSGKVYLHGCAVTAADNSLGGVTAAS